MYIPGMSVLNEEALATTTSERQLAAVPTVTSYSTPEVRFSYTL